MNDQLHELAEQLVCPVHGTGFDLPESFRACGARWPDGILSCEAGCEYKIKGGIPRFVDEHNYADAFGLQWQRYRQTQLDSYTGQPISLRRLERCLGMPVSELNDKKVLECGSGAGRFTEHLLGNAGLLVSMDFSGAVEANLCNLGDQEAYLLLQSDINQSPLPREYFDVVICLGVVQHTPSPEQTISSLATFLAPGGLLVIDHYPRLNYVSWLNEVLTLRFPLRQALKRVPPNLGLRATTLLTAICDPVRRQTCRAPWVDRVAARLFPSFCYYRTYPELPKSIIYEWNELDTHDALTDYYKHRRSPAELRTYLSELGLTQIHAECAGNGVEVRAVRP